MFSEKLNFIMNVTRTQASALGKACDLDPSYVSRLKGGSRPLPKRPEFFETMTEYLAERVINEHQKGAVCDVLRLTSYPTDTKLAARLIGKWLTAKDEGSPDISPLIECFASPRRESEIIFESEALPEAKSCYYGTEGKREAVLQFFSMILKEKEPQTLLLLGEEEMDWLYEDAAFAARGSAEFTKVLMAGNRVKIIHNIGRSMNEMLEAVAKWIPVYNTGMIEPFYYPKLRDGVFQRTLFIAPKTAAIVSASVDHKTNGMPNMLVTDKEAVSAFALEFNNYLSLCHPLMNIVTVPKRGELWEAYNTLISTEGNMICMSNMPTIATMPERVAKAMQSRAPESCIYSEWKAVRACLRRLKNARYTEIIAPHRDKSGEIPLPCADMFGASGLCYTEKEWQAHVENSAKFAATHSSYSQLIKEGVPDNICLFVKEGRGVIMTKNNAPETAFAFSESNMVGAFTDYLKRLMSE